MIFLIIDMGLCKIILLKLITKLKINKKIDSQILNYFKIKFNLLNKSNQNLGLIKLYMKINMSYQFIKKISDI